MKHILSILFIAALAVSSVAQSFDEERMHRDLEVAENALSTIISTQAKDSPRWTTFGDDDVDGGYIKDYGVVFMVSNKGMSHSNLFGKVKNKDKGHKSDKGKASAKGVDTKKNYFIENSKIFLADYAGIIGQLNDDHRISIRSSGSNSHNNSYGGSNIVSTTWNSNGVLVSNVANSEGDELIIETTVGQINALRRGDVSRNDFLNSVSVVENVMNYDKDPGLETLSAMFHRLYKKDLSTTYYSERTPKYSKLSNFGVIVKMKFYSSYEDNNVYSMPTISKEGLTLEQRNQHVMELLPKFEADFKENLINYGRTLKNLDSNEILLFEINMTTCKNCKDFPRIMKFSVSKSVLHKFNRGELSLNEALELVNVDKISKG